MIRMEFCNNKSESQLESLASVERKQVGQSRNFNPTKTNKMGTTEPPNRNQL